MLGAMFSSNLELVARSTEPLSGFGGTVHFSGRHFMVEFSLLLLDLKSERLVSCLANNLFLLLGRHSAKSFAQKIVRILNRRQIVTTLIILYAA